MKVKFKILKEDESKNAARFVKSFRDSSDDLFKSSDKAVKRLIAVLDDFAEEFKRRLEFFLPSDIDAPFLTKVIPQIKQGLAQAISELNTIAQKDLLNNLEDAFDLGAIVTPNAFKSAGLPIAFPVLDAEILKVLSRDAVNLWIESTKRLDEKITTQLNRSAAGLQPASQAIVNIERELRTDPVLRRGGIRRRTRFAFQAEQITRTELGRIFSVAQQNSSEIIASDSIPDLRKMWDTTGDTRVRRGHKDAERIYKPGGSIGPIPIKSRFVVKDFSRTGFSSFLTLGKKIKPKGFKGGQRAVPLRFRRRGRVITDRMLHPRDPSASAGNVILCRCVVMDIPPDLEKALNKVIGLIQ